MKIRNGSRSSHILIFLVVVCWMLFAISISAAGTEKSSSPKIEKIQENKLTAWNIVKMTDWLLWPFVAITAAGLMLLIYRSLYEHREKARARTLMQGNLTGGDLRGYIQMVQMSPPNRASKLLQQMLATFKKTSKAAIIGEEVDRYLNEERQSFETFQRVIYFLSDSAGALGLLGTVWGIFQTFHAGKLDGPTILQGMSISLVTTLVGLIISLVLNMGATSIFAMFNGQLNGLSHKAQELRQALLTIEMRSERGAVQPRETTSMREPARYHPDNGHESIPRQRPAEAFF